MKKSKIEHLAILKLRGELREAECEDTNIVIPCYVYANVLFSKTGEALTSNWRLVPKSNSWGWLVFFGSLAMFFFYKLIVG